MNFVTLEPSADSKPTANVGPPRIDVGPLELTLDL